MATILLVDGHAYAYRAYHAIRDLRSPEGKPTNAIFGFVKMLARLRALTSPEYVAVLWDGGLSSERVELLPEYKAQRPPMPDGLAEQIEQITEVLGPIGVRSVEREGVEADDLVASVAKNAVAAGMRVVVASSDKDFFQLVSPVVGLLNPADKSEMVWGEAKVLEKTGVRPEQVVDWLSLIGDAVDNIRGVPGIGPKTAADLLRRFGSVDELYNRLAEVSSERIRRALAESENVVRRNQKMVRLNGDITALPSPEELVIRASNYGMLCQLYQKWGFRSLAAEAGERARGGQQDLFAVAG
jgi:DNA polymerase I